MLLFALWLATAAAEPPPPAPVAVDPAADARARELFENGAALYEEGRYEDALAAWTEAWRLSGRPLLLYNIASAAEHLGRLEEAIDHLSRYRAYAPAEEQHALALRIAGLERRLAAQDPHVAPLPPRRGLAPAPIALLGLGAASVATGTVFGFLAVDARADAAALCTTVGGVTRCPESAAGALARERRDALVADVSVGAGLLAIGGGLLAALLPTDRVHVGMRLGADGGVVSVGGELP